MKPEKTGSTAVTLPDGYTEMFNALKTRVRAAQHQAHRVVNEQLIQLY